MSAQSDKIFSSAAVFLLLLAAFPLVLASPLLFILGLLFGFESGSTLGGIADFALVMGLPWATYALPTVGAILLWGHNRPRLALLSACVPLAVESLLLAGWRGWPL
jgi:hypothetical protein